MITVYTINEFIDQYNEVEVFGSADFVQDPPLDDWLRIFLTIRDHVTIPEFLSNLDTVHPSFEVYGTFTNVYVDVQPVPNDWQRLFLINRNVLEIADVINFAQDAFPGKLENINDTTQTTETPPPLTGTLYKLEGVVTELTQIPSKPTNVLLVDRTDGQLSTITITPEPDGTFIKYYKDLPPNQKFMVIAVWGVDETPYYKPVLIDRVVPTQIA